MQTYGRLRVKNRTLGSLEGKATYIGGNTSDDELILASGLDGSAKVSVVPGIDLTTPADDGNVGVHVCDLREKRAVWTLNMRGKMSH